MELITELLMLYIPMYAPSIVAIISVVVAIIPLATKLLDALKAFKNSDELKQLAKQLQEQSAENKELVRCNKLLLDRLTKIEGYADKKKEED